MIYQFVSLTSGSLSRNPLRTLFLLLTIVGTVVAFMLTEAASRELSASAISTWNTQPYDLSIVGSDAFSVSHKIREIAGIQGVENVYRTFANVNGFGGDILVVEDGHMVNLKYESGRGPQAEDEIAVGSFVAKRDRLEIGSEARLSRTDDDAKTVGYRVCGIAANYIEKSVVTREGLTRLEPSPEQYQTVLVARDASIDVARTKEKIESVIREKDLKVHDHGESQYIVDSTVYKITSATSGLVLISGMSSLLILLGLYQRDRSYELGVLRALGYSKTSVFLVLAFDSLVLIVTGLLIGLFGSVAVMWAFRLGNLSTLIERNGKPTMTVGIVSLFLAIIISYRTSNSDVTRLLRVER